MFWRHQHDEQLGHHDDTAHRVLDVEATAAAAASRASPVLTRGVRSGPRCPSRQRRRRDRRQTGPTREDPVDPVGRRGARRPAGAGARSGGVPVLLGGLVARWHGLPTRLTGLDDASLARRRGPGRLSGGGVNLRGSTGVGNAAADRAGRGEVSRLLRRMNAGGQAILVVRDMASRRTVFVSLARSCPVGTAGRGSTKLGHGARRQPGAGGRGGDPPPASP
ncbi:hypothetical protein ACRAWF_13275 [Streptomyces sp. L7]